MRSNGVVIDQAVFVDVYTGGASLVTAGVLRRRPCLVDLGDHVKRFDVYGLAQ